MSGEVTGRCEIALMTGHRGISSSTVKPAIKGNTIKC
jgi:hypothetical protein